MALPPSEPVTGSFVSLVGRAKVAVAGLFIVGVVHALAAGAGAWLLRLIGRSEAGEVITLEEVSSVASVVEQLDRAYWLGLVLASVAFIVWFHRAYSNLGAHAHNASAAIYCWFIPFVNLVMPYAIATDIWAGSRRDRETPERERGSGIIKWWWGFWVVSGVIGAVVVVGGEPTSIEAVVRRQYWAIAGNVLRVMAAVLAIIVVRRITARQHDGVLVRAKVVR